MTTTEYILVLLFCGIATYLTRMPMLVFTHKLTITPTMRRFMRYIGPSVIIALIAPSIFVQNGALNANPLTNFYIPAALVTALVALLVKKPLPAILSGIATAFVLSLLG